jgi:hypothetical protein
MSKKNERILKECYNFNNIRITNILLALRYPQRYMNDKGYEISYFVCSNKSSG